MQELLPAVAEPVSLGEGGTPLVRLESPGCSRLCAVYARQS